MHVPEPPRFDAAGTVGGAIAAGLSGPRRPYSGAARDFVLGMRIIDGTGAHLSFGGRVMKNVAGFDVSRLQTGALGTLGVITEVSLKCLPLPKTETTLVQSCSAEDAVRRVNAWSAQPLPLSATCHCGGELRIRHAGREITVDTSNAEFSELSYVAFYADCEHEALPVQEGNRVCLVYNLIQKPANSRNRTLVAPEYETQITEAAA